MSDRPSLPVTGAPQTLPREPFESFERLAGTWQDYVAGHGPIPDENSYRAGYLRGLELAAKQLQDRIRWAESDV